MNERDKRILALKEKVDKKRSKIEEMDKMYTKRTNCVLEIDDKKVNINAINNVDSLVDVFSKLINYRDSFTKAQEELGLEVTQDVKFGIYTFGDWKSDIKNKIDKINVKSEKQKLVKMEEQLNAAMSEDLKTDIALDAIENDLE